MSRAFPSRRYYDILLKWLVYSLWLLPDQPCAHVFLTRFSNRETSWLYLVHYRSLRPAWVACSRRLPSPHCVLGLYLYFSTEEPFPCAWLLSARCMAFSYSSLLHGEAILSYVTGTSQKAVVCPCVANLCPYLLHRGAVFSHGEANFCTRFYPLCSKIILLPSPRRNLFPVCG